MAKSRPGRLSGKAARQNSAWQRPRTLIIAGVAVLAIGGAAGVSIALDDSSSGVEDSAAALTPGQKWSDEVKFDLAGASQSTLDYLKVINDWTEGKQDNEAMSAAADRAFLNYTEALGFLEKRSPFEEAPRALANFRDSFQLLTETARLAKLGSGIESDELRKQFQLQISRLRNLGDRFYDLANTEMEPYLPQRPVLDDEMFQFIRNPEVPSFAGTNVAPGPPLTEASPETAEQRGYQEVRPVQEFAEWVELVKDTELPTPQEQVDAIEEADVDALGELADQLTAASDALYEAADPRESRHLNTRVQLGLLVQAEAMRTGQLAALLEGEEAEVATTIAQTLALVASRMWDDRLGTRTVDLPETLLERKPI